MSEQAEPSAPLEELIAHIARNVPGIDVETLRAVFAELPSGPDTYTTDDSDEVPLDELTEMATSMWLVHTEASVEPKNPRTRASSPTSSQ